MGYQIRYDVRKRPVWKWTAAGVCTGTVLWCTVALSPVWRAVGAGEGLYEALARFVGGMIRAH